MLKDCEYVEMECSHEDCKDKISRKNLKSHEENCTKKKIQCIDCKEMIFKSNIQIHKEECPEALIECPSTCGERIIRRSQ